MTGVIFGPGPLPPGARRANEVDLGNELNRDSTKLETAFTSLEFPRLPESTVNSPTLLPTLDSTPLDDEFILVDSNSSTLLPSISPPVISLPKPPSPRASTISPNRSQSFPTSPSPTASIVIAPNFRHSALPALNFNAEASSSADPRQSISAGQTSPILTSSFRNSGALSPEPTYYRSNSMDGPYPSIMSTTTKVKGKEERTGYNFGKDLENRNSMVGVGLGGGMMGTLIEIPATATDSTVKVGLPPHLIAQPEICVECMMRDRDMIDIDVTTPGVWDRNSDVDLEEWEEEGGSAAFCQSEDRSRSSKDSHGGSRASTSHGGRRAKGQNLTIASLKIWTAMNIPASSHRWRTLQVYLANQLVLIQVERQARIDSGAISPSRSSIITRQSTPSLQNSDSPPGRKRSSTFALVERELRAGGSTPSMRSPTPVPESRPQSSIHVSRVKDYSSGDQPWLPSSQGRRSSAPMLNNSYPYSGSTYNESDLAVPLESNGHSGRPIYNYRSSTTDLGARYDSQGRRVINEGGDQRRNSVWSRFRQSASQSVLSLAPSGSMLDMHLGLSMDKHSAMQNAPYGNYPSPSDPAVARHVERERSSIIIVEAKKKKKGLKGLLSKLIGDGKKSKGSTLSPYPLDQQGYDEDYPLSPPPPMPVLFSEPGPRYHSQRPNSISSVDSSPLPQFTAPHPRSVSVPVGSPSSSTPGTPTFPPQFSPEHYTRKVGGGDRSSIITTGSGSSRYIENIRKPEASSPELRAPSLLRSDSDLREILTVEQEQNAASLRREKSLPSIPRSISPIPPLPTSSQSRNRNTFYSQHAPSTHSIRSPSLRADSPLPPLNPPYLTSPRSIQNTIIPPEPIVINRRTAESRAQKVRSKIFPTILPAFKRKSKFQTEGGRTSIIGEREGAW